ncbi:MAG: hypothetical protein LPK00_09950 [Bacillaceae bacterium]|nr:hypothetical protein [Bacillaceae bacterium]
MITPLIERLFTRINEKGHLQPLLPNYALTCAIHSDGEIICFSFSKNEFFMLDDVEKVDVKLEGSIESILSVISGITTLRKTEINFTGSFRHKLLLDSIFTLGREKENILTDEKIVL